MLKPLSPATHPRDPVTEGRLLTLDARDGASRLGAVTELATELHAGDALVLNDAATFPASLRARLKRGELETEVEVRLLPAEDPEREWQAILLGPGSWRERTEDRAPPPAAESGDVLVFGQGLEARVAWVSRYSPRWVGLRFNGATRAELWRAVYRLGSPIQYSYLEAPLDLWSVQTAYASRPWAAEMPSAGRPISASILLSLHRRGVRVATLTHATGISSSGDPALDRLLPFPEFYEIGEAAAAALNSAIQCGGRVIAVGTSAVRALESQAGAPSGRVVPGRGVTGLILDESSPLRIASGLVTGVHEPGESHFRLLQAFAPTPLLQHGLQICRSSGFLTHEFGDSLLIFADPERRPPASGLHNL